MAPKKPSRVKARQPRGFVDRTSADLAAQERMLGIIRGVFERYGFEPVETPLFEYTDALGKFLPDSDRPNEGVFSLQDDDEAWLSLRYDLTAPLARYVAENFEDLPKPYRSYRAGYVFRNEKPGPGRFRQFMQFDADIVGAPNVSADAEMAMMMADTMEALGIRRGQYVIRVNNRKLLDGLLQASGLEGEHNAGRRLTAMRALDKYDKFGRAGVRLLLTGGRLDESGDFTSGAGLDLATADQLIRVLTLRQNNWAHEHSTIDSPNPQIKFLPNDGEAYVTDMLSAMEYVYGFNDLFSEGLNELRNIAESVEAAGYGKGQIHIDPSVVRGLEYYTGPVFEAELLFDVVNEKGQKVQFGSVGGGGRYDGLVSRFMSTPVPATGFSIGVSRLQTALKNLGRLDAAERSGPVVVTVMDRERMADYQRMASVLRDGLNPRDESGAYLGPAIPVEVFQGNPKQFGKQLQYADRRNAPVVVIQGGDEKAAGQVQVKDLVEGKRIAEGIEDNAEWREARAGQELVSVLDADGKEDLGKLVAAVRAILARHATERETAGR